MNTKMIDPFELFVKRTNEYGESGVLTRCLNDILSKRSNRHKFLDIGCGFGGNLTVFLSKYFDKTTIIEPNKSYFDSVMQSSKFEGLNNKLEEIDIKEKFDFILVSHVFYYIDKKEWDRQLERMIKLLAENGILAIVLQSEKSDLYKIPNKFLEEESRICSEKLISILKNKSVSLKVYEIETESWVNDENEKEILTKFLLNVHQVPFSQDKINSFWTLSRNKFIVKNKEHVIICSLNKSLDEN